MDRIPIVIGVSGHRDLRIQDISKLESIVNSEISNLMEKYPNSPFLLLSSLAEGADQLCAKIALELDIDVVAPLPRDLEDFKRDFKGDALEEFEKYIDNVREYFVVPDTESRNELDSLKCKLNDDEVYRKTRHFGYRQAGIYIAKHSHILLALHDGSDPTQGGCGTAEAIDFKLNHSYNDVNMPYFKTSQDQVIEIRTPREKSPDIGDPFKVFKHPDQDCLDEIIDKTDEFNKDVVKNPEKSSPLLSDKEVSTKKAKLIDSLHGHAGKLSGSYKDKYIFNLKFFSGVAFLIVFSFMIYDEAKLNLGMIMYTFIFIGAAIYLYVINKKEYHRKFLEYRVLAECLRVEFFLNLLEIPNNIYESLTWVQRNEVLWIHKAIEVTLIGEDEKENIDIEYIKSQWIEDQLNHHTKKIKEDKVQEKINTIFTRLMLTLSLILGLIMLILEFANSSFVQVEIPLGILSKILLMQNNQEFLLRDVFKMAFVLASAITLFLSNYYGKLPLSRKISDHKNMINLYSQAIEKFEDENNQKKEVFLELAQEEIIENGNWLSYSKDNEIDISI
ncbi:hypothetical protein [Methanobrevibacter curvatus]|uniref:SMODS and SLOG-associating 2TM effector domain-containing protein n=1 Tax=Methanobrevibacter curvatus TaxID=49547 RepID=A0A166C4Z9_9EURY|nr:hypothetical protein [Methanobrevibacter curvatus]KZX11267.1 hypothetical protein MBCUR_14500 [Methanobrevibacter curvatus]